MGSESQQKKLGRVNRPRVHISYDVETNGALKKVELPFVVGVMADLTGQPNPNRPLPPLRDRKFVDISHENFNAVLEKAAPYLNFRVADKLSGKDGGTIGVELNFKTFEDFDPARVAEKIPELNKLLEMRHKLAQLKANMAGNHKLEEMLADIIQNTEKATELAKAMGPQDKPEGTTNG